LCLRLCLLLTRAERPLCGPMERRDSAPLEIACEGTRSGNAERAAPSDEGSERAALVRVPVR
jgi:hypothetical protein